MTGIEAFIRDSYGRIATFMSGSRQASNRDLLVWTLGAVMAGYLIGQAAAGTEEPEKEHEDDEEG